MAMNLIPGRRGTQEKAKAEYPPVLHILTLKLLHVMIEALLDGCRVPQGALQIGYRFRKNREGVAVRTAHARGGVARIFPDFPRHVVHDADHGDESG